MQKISIFWFRRDLRLDDNRGLEAALSKHENVQPLFIFDKTILKKLEDKDDARLSFIHATLVEMNASLEKEGASLLVRYGKPEKVWKDLIKEFEIEAVYTNKDYEPYALERDTKVQSLLRAKNIDFHSYKDQVIFEKEEILKGDGTPYVVFTPYSKKWRARLDEDKNAFKYYNCKKHYSNFNKTSGSDIISLKAMGFKKSVIEIPGKEVKQGLIKAYKEQRNFPAIKGTSRLGIHFRFGTISIREKARKSMNLSFTFVNELIWRDFYSQILGHFPHVATGAFRAKYERIEWRSNDAEFEAWCEGKTGYPLVDAGMRELNATGFMHNRVRMLVASFLTKHLLMDWRLGEAWFARKLLDFDLASNNGGWQWAAGCGTDAAPYFRIFNPTTQLDKFDKQRVYVKKWIPEFDTPEYPAPIVEHKFARERCLASYKEALI